MFKLRTCIRYKSQIWCPHPAHFEKIYYEYKMKLLDSLISGEISSIEIDEQYKKIYNDEIQRIKSKKIIK